MDEFTALRCNMYAHKCGDDSKKKIKGIINFFSKDTKFEEFKKSLDGEKYQKKCDNYFLISINHEMYIQKAKEKPTRNQFDYKLCYINDIESNSWS